MFDIFYSGGKPNLFAHEQEADNIEHARKLSRTEFFWWITYLSDYSNFDFLYVPKPWEQQYTHVWPSQHHEYSGTYLVPKYTDSIEYLFHKEIIPNKEIQSNFKVLYPSKFDFTWAPHPFDPPYIYIWGNQWWPAEKMPTVEYRVPGASEIKYMDQPAELLPDDSNWQIPECIDPVSVDMSWHPDPGDPPYIYEFATQWQPNGGARYIVPGATEIKYVNLSNRRLPNTQHWKVLVSSLTFDYSWHPDNTEPPYNYVFGNQWWPAEKMPTVEYCMPGATEQKFVDTPIAQLLPDMKNWHIPESVDTTGMDFSWVSDPGEPPYIYQFATQHQKTGGPQYRAPGATEFKYVDMMRAEVKKEAVPIVEIDHLDGNAGQIPNTVKKIRYFDNYRDTLIRLAKSLEGQCEHVWVCSSICDYTNFDFSWHPETWQSTMLHVFPSNDQKFGDTFYMHVPTFAERAEKKQLLEWYSVNYVSRKSVPRRAMPVIEHTADTHVSAVKSTDWSGPVALFTINGMPSALPTIPLWRQEVKTIVPLSTGASAVVVPKTAKGDIKTQLYDYAYIDKTQRTRHKDQPLDIVFISNGELEAEQNYARLIETCRSANKVHRVANVKGRVAAYHAAAQASTTPWFFAVFAKLKVNSEFDFRWQPDRMQQAKHYIFHAVNPINGLVYGHQAMIAYNKQLVLANTGHGLDFTLDSAHQVVPLISGETLYYTDDWTCWRTAFREAIKLRASLPDVENEYRLRQWLEVDSSEGQWSKKGAQDAVEYYEEVQGDFNALKKSYEWDWLADYAFKKRSLKPNR